MGGSVAVVVLLLASSLLAVPAAADPTIAVFGGTLERDATTVGEPVNLTVELKNSGSGGATTLDVQVDDVSYTEHRVVVPAESSKTTGVPLTFDETGTYDVSVNGERAGTVEVVRARVKGVTERPAGRTISVVGTTDGSDATVSATVPPATNQSLYLDRITLRSAERAFNAGFESYVPSSAAPIIVPEGPGSTVLGAFRTGGQLGVETTNFRLVVRRELLLERDVGTAQLTVYQQDGTNYVPLETELVDQTDDQFVYEVTVDDGNRFVVGHLEPRFETTDTVLRTDSTDAGVRVSVTGTVSNAGGVGGNDTVQLRIDGSPVAETSVNVPASGSTDVTLEHVVTSQGEHEIALGDQVVGYVEVSAAGEPVGSTGDAASSDDSVGGALGPGLVGGLGLGGFGPASIAVGASVAILGAILSLAVRE